MCRAVGHSQEMLEDDSSPSGERMERRAFVASGSLALLGLSIGCGKTGTVSQGAPDAGTAGANGGSTTDAAGAQPAPAGSAGAAANDSGTPNVDSGLDAHTGGTGPSAGTGQAAAGAGGGGGVDVGEGEGGVACPSTLSNIEGPLFTPDSPERWDLVEPGMAGTRLQIEGRVLGLDCAPISNAVLDFWQADHMGAYDNVGYTLRGHSRVDAEGGYRLSTIVPGRYLNGDTYRPAHIHVKVYVGAELRLTTQLYFEGDPFAATDPWILPELTMALQDGPQGKRASFDFSV